MKQLLLYLSLLFVFTPSIASDEEFGYSSVRDTVYSTLNTNNVVYFSYVPQLEIYDDLNVSALIINEQVAVSLYMQYADGKRELAEHLDSITDGFISAVWASVIESSPVLVTQWSRGAHGQAVRIYAPSREKGTTLVYEKAGAYFASYEILEDKVVITYDDYAGEGEMETKTETWPM